MDPATLVPWDRNPRQNNHAVEHIANSIQRFGFASPIVARREDLRVIAGHTRLRAALQLGLEQVPVRLLDVSTEEADALALADNKLGEIADWDDDALAALLSELEDADGLGWSEGEISKLVGALDVQPPEAFPEFDESIETQHTCPMCSYSWSGAS